MKENEGKKPSALLLFGILLVLLLAGSVAGLIYWSYSQGRVYVEKSEITAPVITLSPATSGVLQQIFVDEGDYVRKNMVLAHVDDSSIKAKTDGIVVSIENTVGQIVTPQTPVIRMVNPADMFLVGHLAEDKGLQFVHPGMSAEFTMDAFPGRKYNGIVSSVSPAARQSDIVFSISDKREEKEFDIKVKFDTDAYPELRQGMSAKLWIIK
ncbi:MAG: HlyD family efflux transporter periplasmic adaptor subunit [Nanoarchaeota archaeon]|nr:MAG: HlyD family efflux transporter periplasmic adaptor subunit [Nanoarchaeota archaeon]